jgi:hypothetical protein
MARFQARLGDTSSRGSLAVDGVVVQGRLSETLSGLPVLQVPEEVIFAVGTTDPRADVATQAHVATCMSNPEPKTPDRLPKNVTGAPWAPVYGELLTFDDPETRLPAIDRLEGFHPGGSCLYRRVLVPVQVKKRPPRLALCGGGPDLEEVYASR